MVRNHERGARHDNMNGGVVPVATTWHLPFGCLAVLQISRQLFWIFVVSVMNHTSPFRPRYCHLLSRRLLLPPYAQGK